MEPKRMSAEEKDALLKEFHPDYRPEGFAEIKIGPNKGEKAPVELCNLLMSNSRLLGENIDLNKVDYDVDVLVIGGGGAGCSAAIEASEAGAKVMIATKLRIGDANTMMAEGGIQAADKPNDSPARHYLDAFGGGHFAARPRAFETSRYGSTPTRSLGSAIWALCSIRQKTARWSPPTAAEHRERECMPARTIPVQRS